MRSPLPRPSLRHIVSGALVAVACAAPAPLAKAGPEGPFRWTPSRVVDMPRATAAEISPDGNRVLYALTRPRAAGEEPGPAHANLWSVPFEGGAPRRLTSAAAEDKSPAWSPDGTRVAFLSKRGGKEALTRLWVMPIAGGEPVAVSPEKTAVLAFAWAPHGRSIAYVASDPTPPAREKAEKEGRDWVVVEQDLRPRRLWIAPVSPDPADSSRAPRVVSSAGDRSVWEFDWSPHGNALVAAVSPTPRTDDSYMGKSVVVLPLGDGQAREIRGTTGKVGQVAWSLDGRTIAVRGGVDRSDPFAGSVFLIPAGGGAPLPITGDRHESVQDIAWLEDGRLAMVSVRGTRTALSVVKATSPSRIEDLVAPGPAVFTSVSFSDDGSRYAMTASTAEAPPAPFGGPRRREPVGPILEPDPAMSDLPLAQQQTFAWRASDGLEIEGVLMRPRAPAGRDGYPLVVVVHGGPESQYLDGWNTSYNTPGHALAERGYLVFHPNYRGSTGRGVAFSKADHRDLGGREMADVLDGIDAVARAHPVDRRRIGITGGSYGGYFTALAVTRHSDRFAAGAVWFGITNWSSFMGVTDIPLENAAVHWDLWCYERPDTCWQASPIAHIGTARTPTLILQGEADARVPRSQSDELHAALRWKGVPVEYVVFPREEHGFRERAHQIEALDRVLSWFDRHMIP